MLRCLPSLLEVAPGPSPSYCRLPRCRMAASSFEISQFSVSVNMSTFMAERMLAYSWLSSRPSQVTQLPWWQEVGKRGAEGCHRDHRLPPERQCLGWASLGFWALTSPRTPPENLESLWLGFSRTRSASGEPGRPFFPRVRGARSLMPGLPLPPCPAVTAPRPYHAPRPLWTHTLRDLNPSPGAAWGGRWGGDCRQAGCQGVCPTVCAYETCVCVCVSKCASQLKEVSRKARHLQDTHTFVVPYPSSAIARICVHAAG